MRGGPVSWNDAAEVDALMRDALAEGGMGDDFAADWAPTKN